MPSAMKLNKYKTYFMYKSLSDELFSELPTIDTAAIICWSPDRRSSLYRDLLVRYSRNKRCAELRADYRDRFVLPADRDEQHEQAIREASRRSQFYLQAIEEINGALLGSEAELQGVPQGDVQSSTSGARLPHDTTEGVIEGAMKGGMDESLGVTAKSKVNKQRRAGRGRSKRLTIPPAITDGFPGNEEAFWSEVQQEAYGHTSAEVDALYDRLLQTIVRTAKGKLRDDPGARVVHTLAKYVLACYGLRTGSSTFNETSFVEWMTAALRRTKACAPVELRNTVTSVINEYDFSRMPSEEDAGLLDVAKTLGYGKELVPLAPHHIDAIMAAKPDLATKDAYFKLQRDALMVWILTHVHGPFIGNLALSKNEHVAALIASAERLSTARSFNEILGVTLLDFNEEEFLASGEVTVVKHLQAFRNGYRVVTDEAVLTFDQYRRIFMSRFRQVYSRTVLQKEDSAEEADALFGLLIGLLLADDRPAHILSVLMSRTPDTVKDLKAPPLLLRHAAAVACQFLMMGPVTVAAILGGKDCFDSFNARLRNGLCGQVPV